MSIPINNESVERIYKKMCQWRQDFHHYAESGWLELRTASIVADQLSRLGYQLALGKEVINADSRMGLPDNATLSAARNRALAQGAVSKWLPYFENGFTGLVATLKTSRPGPTLAVRVDMDALDLQESCDPQHRPYAMGFSSVNANMTHACGHDGHTALGIGIAHLLMEHKTQLCGTIKLIFQPAEEGTRGAKSMRDAGVVDDVDLFIAIHLGIGVPDGEVVCGSENFLATTKFDVSFNGTSAHAGGNPQVGKNALLAAAQATLGMHAISRHSDGASRINVGVFNAGSGRNVIAQQAQLKVECRGENNAINDYMLQRCQAVIAGAATMYDIDYAIDIVGAAQQSTPSPQWVDFIVRQAQQLNCFNKVHHQLKGTAGSEDATYFMQRVQERGGQATYMIFGTELAAVHHNDRFDFNETVLKNAARLLITLAITGNDFYTNTD